jgi:hypothetical protein
MFANFIAEHKRLRILTTPTEEENATVVQTVAASPNYEDLKEVSLISSSTSNAYHWLISCDLAIL